MRKSMINVGYRNVNSEQARKACDILKEEFPEIYNDDFFDSMKSMIDGRRQYPGGSRILCEDLQMHFTYNKKDMKLMISIEGAGLRHVYKKKIKGNLRFLGRPRVREEQLPVFV